MHPAGEQEEKPNNKRYYCYYIEAPLLVLRAAGDMWKAHESLTTPLPPAYHK